MRRHPRGRTVQVTGFVAKLHIIPVFTVFATLQNNLWASDLMCVVVVPRGSLFARLRPNTSHAPEETIT